MARACISILALLFITACSDPLPEHYGVFALDGGKLTQLGDNTPEELRRNFSKNISIIVYDKRLGAAADLNELLIFTGRAYVRNQIEHVLARVDGPEKTVNTASISSSIPRDTINVNYKPVEGKPEMVQAVPVEPLEPGLYAMIFPPDEGYFFSVGIGNIAEAESPHNDCLDLHVTTVDKDAPFSWKTWNQLSIGRIGQRRMIEGNPIMEENLEPCAAWDGRELGLQLIGAIEDGDYNLAKSLIDDGAYVDIKTLQLAQRGGRADIVELLTAAGVKTPTFQEITQWEFVLADESRLSCEQLVALLEASANSYLDVYYAIYILGGEDNCGPGSDHRILMQVCNMDDEIFLPLRQNIYGARDEGYQVVSEYSPLAGPIGFSFEKGGKRLMYEIDDSRRENIIDLARRSFPNSFVQSSEGHLYLWLSFDDHKHNDFQQADRLVKEALRPYAMDPISSSLVGERLNETILTASAL